MRDEKTIREELAAMQAKADRGEAFNREYAANCLRWLRSIERREEGRNPVTGY